MKNNSWLEFGIMLGIWTMLNQVIDALTLKLGYLEFSSMWAGVVTLLLIGSAIEAVRWWRNR
jgi:hypothetical protein